LSSWDLVGALPIDEKSVAERVADGDYRWVNRGGVDLIGASPRADRSAFGIQRAVALYGSLPEQRRDPKSFSERLRRMLSARSKFRFAEGELLAVSPVQNKACCILALRLPGPHLGAFTVLNFSQRDLEEAIDLNALRKDETDNMATVELVDVLTDEPIQAAGGNATIRVPALSARAIVVRRADQR
jgi:maltose alpha-D-glucosyltransferase/alpha-amylase